MGCHGTRTRVPTDSLELAVRDLTVVGGIDQVCECEVDVKLEHAHAGQRERGRLGVWACA